MAPRPADDDAEDRPYAVQPEPEPPKETKPEPPKPPLALGWDVGWSLAFRQKLFVLMLIADGILLIISLIALGGILAGLTMFLFLGFMQAFILGTFDRLELTRTARGKIALKRTWRIAFYPRPPVRIPWGQFERMVTGKSHETRFEDWVVAYILLCCALIPGILWIYYVVLPERIYVALSQHHGFPDTILYRGTDEAKVRAVGQAIADVTGLPYN